jgi:hypothetical protein
MMRVPSFLKGQGSAFRLKRSFAERGGERGNFKAQSPKQQTPRTLIYHKQNETLSLHGDAQQNDFSSFSHGFDHSMFQHHAAPRMPP